MLHKSTREYADKLIDIFGGEYLEGEVLCVLDRKELTADSADGAVGLVIAYELTSVLHNQNDVQAKSDLLPRCVAIGGLLMIGDDV